jgi:hypothetical protein
VAFLFLGTDAMSKSDGILPTPAQTLTRLSSNSCGGNSPSMACHRISPFLTTVAVDVVARVLDLNGNTSVTVTGTNTGVAGVRGGFCADVTRGALVPGINTRTDPQGTAITHQRSFGTGRSWTFGYQATQAGLAELFTVVNAVNGDGRADGGDEWAFHSARLIATQSTPVRLFVNAAGVTSTGDGCADGYGNHPVFGAATSPSVGNSAFTLEAHGLPGAAQFLLMMSVGGGVTGFDMAPLGAPGCVLRTNLQISVSGLTGPGDSLRGEGSVVLPVPIPNDPKLKGLVLSLQLGALDSNPKRSFPMIVTNGLELKVQ